MTPWILLIFGVVTSFLGVGFAQSQPRYELTTPDIQPQENSKESQSVPLTLTLRDALDRAQKYDAQFLSAITGAKLASEDRVLARASLLPSFGLRSEYLNTQGNGVIPTGRYVTNDGVHVYREWSVVHQDLSPTALSGTGYRRAVASEAVARAKSEIARRGLVVTVTRTYYSLISARRKYATAQQSLEQAKRFLTISQDLEGGGEVAHSDVIRFQLQYDAQERAFREASLVMEEARLDLAVLLFPNFDQNFDIVDDLHLAPPLPPFADVRTMATRENPDLRAAIEAAHAASLDVSIARQALLLMRWSGLRISDAVNLERSRLHGDNLLVYQTKTGGPVFVPLPHVAEALRSMPDGMNPNARYFFRSGGKPRAAIEYWSSQLRKLFKLADIRNADGTPKRCHPHMLRHTFAVRNLESGMPLEEVSTLLGHSSIRITEKYYAPWVSGRQRRLENSVRLSLIAQGVLKGGGNEGSPAPAIASVV
jgi:integrase